MDTKFNEIAQKFEQWFRAFRKENLIDAEDTLNEAVSLLNKLSTSPYQVLGLEAFTCKKCGNTTFYKKSDEESLPGIKGLIQHNPHCCFCGKELIEKNRFILDEEYELALMGEYYFLNPGVEYNVKSIYFDGKDNEEMVVIELNDASTPISLPKKLGHII